MSFRVLHLLVHASALLGIEMEWVQERENIVHLLQVHLRDVACMNCVRSTNDTVWYFKANVEADLAALAKLLNGTVEVATLFIHAVLHRLGSLKPGEQPRDYNLTSHAGWMPTRTGLIRKLFFFFFNRWLHRISRILAVL